jgi:hypothetical protein
MITQLKDDILIKDRLTLLRVIFYLELVIKKGIQLSNNELSILSLFVDGKDKEAMIVKGIENNFIKSKQSGDNIISTLVKLKILDKVGTNKRTINKEHLPLSLNEFIYSTFTIHNLA